MNKVRIVAISDLHHNDWPEIPDCDLLLISGDFLPNYRGSFKISGQASWLDTTCRYYLNKLRDRNVKVVVTPGNHDWIFQEAPSRVPKDLSWEVLIDRGIEFKGIRIWGTPWQPRFFDWAYNLPEKELKEKWALIPEDTEILLTHGPPRGILDNTPDGQRAGSYTLREKLNDLKSLLLMTCGHLHSGHGVNKLGNALIANVAYVDEKYEPYWPIEQFQYEDGIITHLHNNLCECNKD